MFYDVAEGFASPKTERVLNVIPEVMQSTSLVLPSSVAIGFKQESHAPDERVRSMALKADVDPAHILSQTRMLSPVGVLTSGKSQTINASDFDPFEYQEIIQRKQ